MLTYKRLTEVLSYNKKTGVFIRKAKTGIRGKLGETVGWGDGNGYLRVQIDHKLYKLHRLAWMFVHGVMPGSFMDHINHDRSDNRIVNLRLVTMTMNNRNIGGSSDPENVYGVYPTKSNKKWFAMIKKTW